MTLLPRPFQTLVTLSPVLGDRPLHGLMGLISLVLVLGGTIAAPAQAGLFQPLLKLGQPTVESRIRRECENLADQHLGTLLKAQWQPLCQVGAQKITSCLLEQASRQGKEWALLQEGISGKPGAVTQGLLLACAGQLLGLETVPGTVDQGNRSKPSESPAL